MKELGISKNVWLLVIIGILFLGFLSTMSNASVESFSVVVSPSETCGDRFTNEAPPYCRDMRYGSPEESQIIGSVEVLDGIFDLNRIKSTNWWKNGHAAFREAKKWTALGGCDVSNGRKGCNITDPDHDNGHWGRTFFVHDIQGEVVKAYRPRAKGDSRPPKPTDLRLGNNFDGGRDGTAADYKWAYEVNNDPEPEPEPLEEPEQPTNINPDEWSLPEPEPLEEPEQPTNINPDEWSLPESQGEPEPIPASLPPVVGGTPQLLRDGPTGFALDQPGVGESPMGCYWKASGNNSSCTIDGRTGYNNWITNENDLTKLQTVEGCRSRAADVAKWCRGNPAGFSPVEGQDYEMYFN